MPILHAGIHFPYTDPGEEDMALTIASHAVDSRTWKRSIGLRADYMAGSKTVCLASCSPEHG